MHAAHEARSERGEELGIIHRDLTPENVFLRDGIEPVLMDFGLGWRFPSAVGREVFDLPLFSAGTVGHSLRPVTQPANTRVSSTMLSTAWRVARMLPSVIDGTNGIRITTPCW